MAVDYLSRNGLTDRPCRFDVVAVDIQDSGVPKVTVIPGAFALS
jgi:Holliday junction resolvase-like predicted endonuclease